MSFLNPLFLFALVAVGVPVLIYLLNFRKPKRIRFSTLTFFDSLKQSALKRIRIKNWLLLTLRMLALASLALAVAGPLLLRGGGFMASDAPRAVVILIDNSPSMERISREGPYIEQALTIAGDLLSELQNRDAVLIEVTNGESLGLPFQTPSQAVQQLRMVNTLNAGNYTGERLKRFTELLSERDETGKMIWLITDGQVTQFSGIREEMESNDREAAIQIILLDGAETANAAIEEVSLEQGSDPMAPHQLRVGVRNSGDRPLSNTFLSFYSGGELIIQQPFSIEIGGSEEFLFDLPASEEPVVAVEFRVEGDELYFDNHFYGAVHLPGRRQVLLVGEEERESQSFRSFLRPMLEIASEEGTRLEVTFTEPNQIRLSQLEGLDAVILDGVRAVPDFLAEALIERVQGGMGLMLLPAARGSLSDYNRLLSLAGAPGYGNVSGAYGSFRTVDRMAPPEASHPVIEGIFELEEGDAIRLNVPDLFYFLELNPSRRAADQPILSLRTGSPLLMETRLGNGRILYSAIGSDPGWSNFPLKPFFAPLFYNAVNWLSDSERARLLTHKVGRPFRFEQRGGGVTAVLEKEGEFIFPETRQLFSGREITYSAREWVPGWVRLNPDDENILFGVNFDAMESDLRSLSKSELEPLFENRFGSLLQPLRADGGGELAGTLWQSAFGKEIWYWFVFIAMILLLLETVLSKLYKTESI